MQINVNCFEDLCVLTFFFRYLCSLLQCMCSGCAKVLRFQTNRCPICRQLVERLLEIKVNDGNEEERSNWVAPRLLVTRQRWPISADFSFEKVCFSPNCFFCSTLIIFIVWLLTLFDGNKKIMLCQFTLCTNLSFIWKM